MSKVFYNTSTGNPIGRRKKKKPTTFKVNVAIIESERGWGSKIDSIKTFPSMAKAQAFIKKFNAQNNLAEVPDWYMYARLESDLDGYRY